MATPVYPYEYRYPFYYWPTSYQWTYKGTHEPDPEPGTEPDTKPNREISDAATVLSIKDVLDRLNFLHSTCQAAPEPRKACYELPITSEFDFGGTFNPDAEPAAEADEEDAQPAVTILPSRCPFGCEATENNLAQVIESDDEPVYLCLVCSAQFVVEQEPGAALTRYREIDGDVGGII